MNLAEILVYTDIRQLHQIADHYGCECNLHSKNDLITSLMSNLRRRQTILQEVGQLSPAEVHFMLLLFLDRRAELSTEDLLAKAGMALDVNKERRPEAARRFVADALRRGWVFPANSKTAGLFRIPQDLRESYLQTWLDQWRSEVECQTDAPEVYRDEGSALCDDIVQFLQFLHKEPVPLTADGGMYKRYQSQLLQFLHVKEEPLPPQKWRFGYGLHFDLYPDRFSLLYDFCYYHKWIEEIPGRVSITEDGMKQLQQPQSDQWHHELIRFWIRLYKRAIPNLPMLVQLIPLMTAGCWVQQADICRTLLPWIKPFYYDEPANILSNRVLKMMVHLGLLKVGQGEREQWLYSATSASQTWLRKYNGFNESTILLK